MTLAPTHGARFELSLEAGGDAARYRIDVRTPERALTATADLDRDGVRVEWADPPAKWIDDTALGLLRMLRKNHLEDRLWPTRLHRWREQR